MRERERERGEREKRERERERERGLEYATVHNVRVPELLDNCQ